MRNNRPLSNECRSKHTTFDHSSQRPSLQATSLTCQSRGRAQPNPTGTWWRRNHHRPEATREDALKQRTPLGLERSLEPALS